MHNNLRTTTVLDFSFLKTDHYSFVEKICGWSYCLVLEHLITKFINTSGYVL